MNGNFRCVRFDTGNKKATPSTAKLASTIYRVVKVFDKSEKRWQANCHSNSTPRRWQKNRFLLPCKVTAPIENHSSVGVGLQARKRFIRMVQRSLVSHSMIEGQDDS